jgi:hypothetical protein
MEGHFDSERINPHVVRVCMLVWMKIVAITVLLCREYDLLLPQLERADQHGEDAAPVYTGSRRYPGKVFSSLTNF